jgi:hypothetical protein
MLLGMEGQASWERLPRAVIEGQRNRGELGRLCVVLYWYVIDKECITCICM